MIKLIVTDMDGTLLDDAKQLPSDFLDTYQQLQSANIQFAIASGRSVYSLRYTFSHLKNNIIFIGDNGAHLKSHYQSQILASFTKENIEPFIKASREHPELNVIICTEHSAYIENKSWEFYTKAYAYYKNLAMIDDLEFIDAKILKVAIHNAELWPNATEYEFQQLNSEYNMALSGTEWLDVMPPNINKGEAVKLLQKITNIHPEETMIFGDYHNDKEMLLCAKHSYAMENAHPDIKDIAINIAPSNNNNGVTQVIKNIVLNNK